MLTWCLTALIACNLHNTAEYVLGVSIIIWVFKEDTSHEHPSAWLFSAPLLFWWRRHQGTSLPMPSTIQSNPVQWVQTHRICTLLCYVRYRIDPTAKINHINEAIARLIKQPFSHVTSWLIVWLKAGSWWDLTLFRTNQLGPDLSSSPSSTMSPLRIFSSFEAPVEPGKYICLELRCFFILVCSNISDKANSHITNYYYDDSS